MVGANMGKQPTNAKTKVFIAAFLVALVIGAAAFAAAQMNARATVESIQADAVREVVSRAQASNSGSYNTITDILGRQSDANGTRQWLLASNNTILYARNASTPNGYVGLPIESYPGGESIKKLLESAHDGEVAHGTVSIDGENYLGSATQFTLGGIQYDLCVLTAASALDGNVPTAPMLALYVLLAIALILLVAIPTFVASQLEKRIGEARLPESALAAPDSTPAPAPSAEPDLHAEFNPESESESASEPEHAAAPGFEPIASLEPETAPIALPLRPRSELEGHLREFLDSGIPGGNLIKITCRNEDAMNRVLLRLGPLAAGSDSHCYEFGDDAFIVELFEIDEPYAREALAQFLQDDAEITAFVSIDDD